MIHLLPRYRISDPRSLNGNAAATASAAPIGIGKQAAVSRTLAELYPWLSTSWVPESILGCRPTIILIVIGFSIASLGKPLKKAYF